MSRSRHKSGRKRSRIKRLIPKKLSARLERAEGEAKTQLEAYAEREAKETIGKMEAKGFTLVTRLETDEGVFVREHNVIGLHIQLPSPLYTRLDDECLRRDTTKRNLVIAALEQYLGAAAEAG